MPVIVVYNIPKKTPDDLFPFSTAVKEKISELLNVQAIDLICCYSLSESCLPNTKVCMTLVIRSFSQNFRDENIKKKIIQQIDHIIKSKFNDCSEIYSEFYGWPDVLGHAQFEQKQEEVI